LCKSVDIQLAADLSTREWTRWWSTHLCLHYQN